MKFFQTFQKLLRLCLCENNDALTSKAEAALMRGQWADKVAAPLRRTLFNYRTKKPGRFDSGLVSFSTN